MPGGTCIKQLFHKEPETKIEIKYRVYAKYPDKWLSFPQTHLTSDWARIQLNEIAKNCSMPLRVVKETTVTTILFEEA